MDANKEGVYVDVNEMSQGRFWGFMAASAVVGGLITIVLLAGYDSFRRIHEYQERKADQEIALQRVHSFLRQTKSDAQLTIGDLTYSWHQAGSKGELTRSVAGSQPVTLVFELEKQEFRMGLKSPDGIEWLQEPPAFFGEDAKRIEQMLGG